MELAMRALGVGQGDEVVVPAWTFAATAIAVSLVGATPVFVDVAPDSLCIDVDAVIGALSPRTKAVIPVHFGGHPCDMDALMSVAQTNDLLVIEDAAQAHAASWRGHRMGSLGNCGSYSFQQSKNLQCGEGGSVVTDDDDLADRLHFSLSKFGRGVRGAYKPFDHYVVAGNACMTEFQAAVALCQLERLEPQSERRAAAAATLRHLLEEYEGLAPLPVDPRVDRHGYHLFLLRYAPEAFGGKSRNWFVDALNAEGVPCAALYARPLYAEGMYDSAVPFRVTDCPVTERACTEIVAIPQNVLLADDSELALIPEAVRKIQQSCRRSVSH
jgi:dTDP-4-amino-4,6-dideoxygalactose transaminase